MINLWPIKLVAAPGVMAKIDKKQYSDLIYMCGVGVDGQCCVPI